MKEFFKFSFSLSIECLFLSENLEFEKNESYCFRRFELGSNLIHETWRVILVEPVEIFSPSYSIFEHGFRIPTWESFQSYLTIPNIFLENIYTYIALYTFFL